MRHVESRPGLYRDSVALMQISSALTRLPAVEAALVAMGTELNLDLLAQMGFAAPAGAGPNDMLVAIATSEEADARDPHTMAAVLAHLEASLSPTASSTVDTRGAVDVSPRTAFTAVRSSGAPVVLVSTPGRYAFVEAMDALTAGASVMIFSDNVPISQEVRLKQTAAAHDLLVMGPDCGTAVVGGIGLGFANVVRPGPVGLVAASGTGAQQVMSLLALSGVGISHCLGVGGRDMRAEVGGLSTRTAMRLLDADPSTELIVVLGKPPAPAVAASLRAEGTATPVLFAPLGPDQPDLTEVAETVLSRLGLPVPSWPVWAPSVERAASPGAVQGLFSGGTLCTEAMVVAGPALGPIRSNVPLRSDVPPHPQRTEAGHAMLDLGSDEYTVGRPHPMIDFGPRLSLLRSAAADPSCRVVLLDVVLGHGAHPDPCAELAPAVEDALGRPGPLDVVVSLVGTADDPQDLSRQAGRLSRAGAWVFASNAAATRHAVRLVGAR
jgi:FdrA protein